MVVLGSSSVFIVDFEKGIYPKHSPDFKYVSQSWVRSMASQQQRHQNDVIDVALFLLLTLNIIHTFLQCFYC